MPQSRFANLQVKRLLREYAFFLCRQNCVINHAKRKNWLLRVDLRARCAILSLCQCMQHYSGPSFGMPHRGQILGQAPWAPTCAYRRPKNARLRNAGGRFGRRGTRGVLGHFEQQGRRERGHHAVGGLRAHGHAVVALFLERRGELPVHPLVGRGAVGVARRPCAAVVE